MRRPANDSLTAATELADQSIIDDVFGEDILMKDLQRKNTVQPTCSTTTSYLVPFALRKWSAVPLWCAWNRHRLLQRTWTPVSPPRDLPHHAAPNRNQIHQSEFFAAPVTQSWTATRLLCCPARTNLLRVSASSAISSNRPSAVPDVAWSSRATSWRRINLSARVARSTRTVLYTNHTLNKFFTIFHTVNFLHVIKSVLQAKYIKQLIVKSRHAYVSKILLV